MTRRNPSFLARWVAASLAALVAAGCGAAPDNDASSQGDPSNDASPNTQPDAVVALDPYVSQPTAVLVGANLVGRADPGFDEPIMTFLSEEEQAVIEAATDVGWLETDLELLATLEPDLILTAESFLDASTRPLYEEIAPTAVIDASTSADWKQGVLEAAAALGAEDVAQSRLDEYGQRVEELRAQIQPQGLTASIVNLRAPDDVRVYVDSCASAVLDELGFSRPEQQPQPAEYGDINVGISLERLPEADADVLFTFIGSTGTNPDEIDPEITNIEANPLWEQLGAVQVDRAYFVDADWWFGCGSVQAAEAIVTDVEEAVSTW